MITIHSGAADDFSGLGMGALMPTECTVEEEAGGMYELTLVQPIDKDGRHMLIANHRIIRAAVPVRESPIVQQDHAPAEVVTREIYRVTTNSSPLNLRQGPGTSYKSLAKLKKGTLVVKQGVSGGWMQVIVQKGGQAGWASMQYLTFVEAVTETISGDAPGNVIEPVQAREQLFRICNVRRNSQTRQVSVTAQHISYDLKGVTVLGEYKPDKVSAATVCQQIIAKADRAHDFTLHCAITKEISGEYGGKNVLECLLDPEMGVLAQVGGRMVRDNFDVYILPMEDRERGAEIRYGKNLLSAELEEDVSDVVTRIRPRGKNKDGDALYITDNGGYVDSPHIDDYPVVYTREIEYDVAVDSKKGFSTDAAARAELKRLAQEDFAKGIDLPTVGLDSEFVRLELEPRYAALASQYALHLYDVVPVTDAGAGICAKARMTRYVWDVVGQAYVSTGLGELTDLKPTVYGYEIGGGVNGTKIVAGTLPGSAVRDASIAYAKIGTAAIDQLKADAIDAVRARIVEITADEITTDTLYAALAEVVTLMVKTVTAGTVEADALYAALADVIVLRAQAVDADNIETDALAAAVAEIEVLLVEQIDADNIETDRLAAALGRFVTLYARVGEFDFATVANLTAEAMVLRQGVGGSVYIDNLVATSANFVAATLGELVIKGADGRYYRIEVASDGTIRTVEVSPSASEIAAGKTAGGLGIVETTANVQSLNAQTVKASSAIIGEILAGALTAEKITAGEALIASATIPTLYVSAINSIGDTIDLSANESITALVTRTEAVEDGMAGAETSAETAVGLAEMGIDKADEAREMAETAQAAAVENATVMQTLQTQVTQTAGGLSVIQTQTIPDMAGRLETLESGVHIEGGQIGIYAAGSPFRNVITNDGWEISENGTPVIVCAETKLTAPRVQVTDALIVGGMAWKPSTDGHLRLLRYGR